MENISHVGFKIQVDKPYDDALEVVISALKNEGFGILTRIDVRATLQEKLNIDFRPYTILGACNPPLAHQALLIDPEIGLMLPCNVTIEAKGKDTSIIRIADPQVMLDIGSMKDNDGLRDVAREAKNKLKRVVELIAQE